MVIDTAYLSEFWSPPQFRIGGWASGRGVGHDKVCDISKAVVKPEDQGVWSGESRGGGESNFG